MRLDLDCSVACTDGAFGELSDLVIDPSGRRVTHVVVQPHDQHDLARLVPIERADVTEGSRALVLDCSVAEINDLECLQDASYLRADDRPPEDPGSDIGIEEIAQVSNVESSGVDGLGYGMSSIDPDRHIILRYDRIPKGMVELRRQSAVLSSDGRRIGHVAGLVLNEQRQITQLVVRHGHLWNKREIAVPVDGIDRLRSDEVVITLPTDAAV